MASSVREPSVLVTTTRTGKVTVDETICAVTGKPRLIATDGSIALQLTEHMHTSLMGGVYGAHWLVRRNDDWTVDETRSRVIAKTASNACMRNKRAATGSLVVEDPVQEFELAVEAACDDVVTYTHLLVSPMRHCTVMEEADLGDLFTPVAQPGYVADERFVRHVIYHVLRGAADLHERGVAHRDFSLENIGLSTATDGGDLPRVRLLDLGQAVRIRTHLDTMCIMDRRFVCGKGHYRSPEVSRGVGTYIPALHDTWCIGVCAFVALFGRQPFSDPAHQDQCVKHLHGSSFISLLDHWSMRHLISREAEDFLSKALRADPVQRPLPRDLLTHEWFSMKQVPQVEEVAHVEVAHVEEAPVEVAGLATAVHTVTEMGAETRSGPDLENNAAEVTISGDAGGMQVANSETDDDAAVQSAVVTAAALTGAFAAAVVGTTSAAGATIAVADGLDLHPCVIDRDAFGDRVGSSETTRSRSAAESGDIVDGIFEGGYAVEETEGG